MAPRRRCHPGFVASVGLAVWVAGCWPFGNPFTPALPPEKAAVRGTLVPASGLSSADYDFFDTVSGAATTVSAAGVFSGEVAGRRTGLLFAAPRPGTVTASKVAAGNGLYMSPAPGVVRVVAEGGGRYALSEDGAAAMDATTTVLSMVLLHPMLAHPWPFVARDQLKWLVEHANGGWPALVDAARAYDAALSGGGDVETDAAFGAAFAQVLADVGTQMPEPAPPDPSIGMDEAAAGLEVPPVNVVQASTGVERSVLTEKARDTTSVTFTPSTSDGTSLDYLVVAGNVPEADAKPGKDGPDVTQVNAYVFRPDGAVWAGFVPASSYFGYADLVGKAMKYVKKGLASYVAPSPTQDIVLPGRKIYEVRFFSGGFQGGTDASVAAFTSTYYGSEAQAAFVHNLVIAAIEAIALVPGGEVVAGDEAIGQKVMEKAVPEFIKQFDALRNAKPDPAAVTAEDVYGIAYSVTKTVVEEVVSQATKGLRTAATEKVMTWLSEGGQKALKLAMSVPGKLAKGGALADRAVALARPSSVMEHHAIAVGYPVYHRVPLDFSTKMDGAALGREGNETMVACSGTAKAFTKDWAISDITQEGNVLDVYVMRTVIVHGSGGAFGENMQVVFSEPVQKVVVTDLGNGRTGTFTWKGITEVRGQYSTGVFLDGETIDEVQQGRTFSPSKTPYLFGSEFTAGAKATYVVTEGGAQVSSTDWFYTYKLTFQ